MCPLRCVERIPHQIPLRIRAQRIRIAFPTRIKNPGDRESVLGRLLRHAHPQRREIAEEDLSSTRCDDGREIGRDRFEFGVELIRELCKCGHCCRIPAPGSLPEQRVVPERRKRHQQIIGPLRPPTHARGHQYAYRVNVSTVCIAVSGGDKI